MCACHNLIVREYSLGNTLIDKPRDMTLLHCKSFRLPSGQFGDRGLSWCDTQRLAAHHCQALCASSRNQWLRRQTLTIMEGKKTKLNIVNVKHCNLKLDLLNLIVVLLLRSSTSLIFNKIDL